MRHVRHLENQPPCPFLPDPGEPKTAAAMRELGPERGAGFYEAALAVASSLWLQGLPAQAILQLNRAFGADLSGDAPILVRFPLPYRALAWILENRVEGQFIGNPRRHFQHLATRMVEPRRELRSWRAWACWGLACLTNPEDSADENQIAEEGVIEPSSAEIRQQLLTLGIAGEADLWDEVKSKIGSARSEN